MKKIYLLLIALMFGCGMKAQCSLTDAVDFSTIDHHGNEINLFEILDGGQYVLIDFFFTACGPCQNATPKVVDAYYALGCNQHDVFFMEISPTDVNNEPYYFIDNWIEEYGIEFPTIYKTSGGTHSGEDICNMYQIPTYPTVILISPDRKIVVQDLWPIDSAQTIIDTLAPFGIEEHPCDDDTDVNYWNPNSSLYPNNMTVAGVLQIDGVEQTSTNWEIGAFCGDEVRGSVKLEYQSNTGRYMFFMTIFGNNGDNITFKLYDHNNGEVMALSSSASIDFVVDDIVGGLTNPYVINFVSSHWIPDTNLYANNMTIISVLEIDGEEQTATNWEIGAFCGDEIRGSAKAQYIQSPVNRYEYFLMVYGENGDEITFRLYDHSTGIESDLMTNNVESFVVNGAIGDIMNPYVISFASDITQSHNLKAGWNWYSTYITVEGSEGLEMMQAGLGDDAIQIKSHNSGFVNYEAGIWFGGLTEIRNEEMYMIKMSSSHVLEMTGSYGDPSLHPITLGTNWKWIGYPVNATMSVNEAFSNITPNNGDYVKSQFHFAQYYAGLGWTGTLSVMEPGNGYMYQNTSGTVKTLVYPSASSKVAVESNVTTDNNHWVADGREYATNMTVIAVVEGTGSDYEVAAFNNGECRGSARPIYVEQLDSYMIFMTVYGEDNDEITFRYYDVLTGEEQAINESMIFRTDATFGDVMNPYVMMLSPASIGESAIETLSIYPNPVGEREEIRLGGEYDVVEVYNSIGMKVAEYKNVSKIDGLETSGVYVVKIVEGDKVTYDRIVVK